MSLYTIIKGCIAKDTKCQKLLYEQYYGYVLRIAFRYIYQYDRAVDVVNDGFVKLFKNIGTFSNPVDKDLEPRLLGWIKKIIVNTAIDELRKNRFVPETEDISAGTWEETSKSNNADANVLYKELICHIRSLSPTYRIVFNMHTIEGFSHQEIARCLNISMGTSKSNLSKAKVRLQKLISRNFADVMSS